MDIDIKELNKTQLILLTLLITFIVSIATGIITVSLMQQMPKSVPQTINNVIQRTIEKVSTVPAPSTTVDNTKDSSSIVGDGDAVISIYPPNSVPTTDTPPVKTDTTVPVTNPIDTTKPSDTKDTKSSDEPKALGTGIIISDVGLILVDSSILTTGDEYKVILNKTDFDATVIKKFTNGFSILKITSKKEDKPVDTKKSDLSANAVGAVTVDNKR